MVMVGVYRGGFPALLDRLKGNLQCRNTVVVSFVEFF